jgi:PIN domain nuclease of toxin-antitoxin system
VSSYILDTHACVYALAAPRKLGRRALAVLRRMDAGKDDVWIPAAVVAEVVLLRELGRTTVGLPELRAATEGAPRLRFLPLDLAQLDQFSAMASIRDPFDRLIIAAARAIGGKLISRNGPVSESGLVEVVWS